MIKASCTLHFPDDIGIAILKLFDDENALPDTSAIECNGMVLPALPHPGSRIVIERIPFFGGGEFSDTSYFDLAGIVIIITFEPIDERPDIYEIHLDLSLENAERIATETNLRKFHEVLNARGWR